MIIWLSFTNKLANSLHLFAFDISCCLNFLEEKKENIKNWLERNKVEERLKEKEANVFQWRIALYDFMLLFLLLVDFFETAEKKEMRSGGIRNKLL